MLSSLILEKRKKIDQLCVSTVYITIVSQTTESFTNPPTSLFLVYYTKKNKTAVIFKTAQWNNPSRWQHNIFLNKWPQFCSLTLIFLLKNSHHLYFFFLYHYFSDGIDKAVTILLPLLYCSSLAYSKKNL